jgi:lipopolysaccharide transport system permease protein
MNHIASLYAYRDLLWLWIAREVRVRYKQSLLGVAWAIVQPLALTLVFTLVFSYLVHIDTGGVPYPVFSYSAMLPWTFFQTSIVFAVPSLVNNLNLVTKIYFPREVLPLASMGAAFLDFVVAFSILLAMLAIYRIWPGIHILWLIPLLAIQIILTTGVVLLGSALIVFFRDVRFVVPLITQIWMYATPIIYPVDLVPERFQPYYFLNPMAAIIDGYRRALVMGEAPRLPALLLATVISSLLLLLGYALFKRVEPLFADLI